jgi:hypothetical protein
VGPLAHLKRWFGAWITALKDRRECARVSVAMVAHYWNGGVAQASEVKTVSAAGAYLLTPDRWSPGTVLRLTFQYGRSSADGQPVTLVAQARIVRFGLDGVGVRLVYLNKKERSRFKKFLAGAPRMVA